MKPSASIKADIPDVLVDVGVVAHGILLGRPYRR
jgi:hypothetical protein